MIDPFYASRHFIGEHKYLAPAHCYYSHRILEDKYEFRTTFLTLPYLLVVSSAYGKFKKR
jgi:hypothetical protein